MPEFMLVTEIAPLRIVAMFILKGALKNEDFLAARMAMGRECAPWGLADDRGRAGDLVPLTIKHPPVHTGSRAGDPIHLACSQQDHFCQIFIDQHPDLHFRASSQDSEP